MLGLLWQLSSWVSLLYSLILPDICHQLLGVCCNARGFGMTLQTFLGWKFIVALWTALIDCPVTTVLAVAPTTAVLQGPIDTLWCSWWFTFPAFTVNESLVSLLALGDLLLFVNGCKVLLHLVFLGFRFQAGCNIPTSALLVACRGLFNLKACIPSHELPRICFTFGIMKPLNWVPPSSSLGAFLSQP
ncbi:hypothetical protein Pelo_17827 [Pelomyxa schiedti]|nr:hypothetical protein Pelo_17827 [Pelomyxa schiedti]